MALPFTEGSFWLTPPEARAASLSGATRAEVAIVGGGYTGMAAALRLAERGVDAVLLEADWCGAGASGRNAGHVTPTIGKDTVTCLRLFGEKRGLALVGFAERAIDRFEETCARYGIDCDYVPAGNIIAGVHARHRKPLAAAAAKAAALGLHLRFLDEGAMRERGIPPAFRFGIHEARGGTITTGKYTAGLRRAVLASGARAHEGTRVTAIRRGEKTVLRTEAGEVTADRVLLATNAYTTPEFGLLGGKTIPVRVSLFVTDVLSPAQRARLGWGGGEGIYTAHEILENYRLTADGRILGGSKIVHTAGGNRLAPGDQPAAFARLERAFRDRFPMLGDVAIGTFWGGWIALTLDFLPVCGWLPGAGRVAYYSGCNGHGIPQCTLMGAAMADELMGEASAEVALLRRFVPPLPPEPLRTGVTRGINWFLERIDRRVDEALRRPD